MKTIIMGFVFFFFFQSQAFCGNPAPYTEEAYNKIHSILSINQPQLDNDSSAEDNMRGLLKFFQNAYAQAGYDLDDTIIEIANDLRNHPERLPSKMDKSVPGTTLVILSALIDYCHIAELENVSCSRFFSPNTLKAIKWIMKNSER